MNYLVTLSFDLYGAESKDYECIKEELEDLNLYETIEDDKGIEFDLPTTTFVGEFNNSHADSLIDEIFEKLKKAFKKCKINGKIFVAVSRDWVWKIQNT